MIAGVGNTYKWTVSDGRITSGIGTSVITVDTYGLSGRELLATVEVSNKASECRCISSATFTAKVYVPIPQASNFGNIHGVVVDRAGKPVAGATVTLSPALGSDTVTDGSGLYRFLGVPAIEYKITVRAGTRTKRLPARLKPNEDLELKIRLPK